MGGNNNENRGYQKMTITLSEYYVDTGLFTGVTIDMPGHLIGGAARPGCGVVSGRHDPLSRRVDLTTGEVVPYQPPAPADTDLVTWTWNTTTERYVAEPTLAAHRLAAWERIKAARNADETAPLPVGQLTFDADADSQQKIAGAVQMAQLAISSGQDTGWSITWTLADNTAATLTAAQMIGVGLALAARTSGLHAKGRALRARIDAAATLDELNAITWD
jgi:hypothetical protein